MSYVRGRHAAWKTQFVRHLEDHGVLQNLKVDAQEALLSLLTLLIYSLKGPKRVAPLRDSDRQSL
jgi:hypothetical protein